MFCFYCSACSYTQCHLYIPRAHFTKFIYLLIINCFTLPPNQKLLCAFFRYLFVASDSFQFFLLCCSQSFLSLSLSVSLSISVSLCTCVAPMLIEFLFISCFRCHRSMILFPPPPLPIIPIRTIPKTKDPIELNFCKLKIPIAHVTRNDGDTIHRRNQTDTQTRWLTQTHTRSHFAVHLLVDLSRNHCKYQRFTCIHQIQPFDPFDLHCGPSSTPSEDMNLRPGWKWLITQFAIVTSIRLSSLAVSCVSTIRNVCLYLCASAYIRNQIYENSLNAQYNHLNHIYMNFNRIFVYAVSICTMSLVVCLFFISN